MNFHVLTLFPEMIEQGLHTSILGKAMEKGYITLETTNIRDFSANKYNLPSTICWLPIANTSPHSRRSAPCNMWVSSYWAATRVCAELST